MFPTCYTAVFATRTTFKLLTDALFNDVLPLAEVPDATTREDRLKTVRKSPSYPLECCPVRDLLERNYIPDTRVSGFDTSVGGVRS